MAPENVKNNQRYSIMGPENVKFSRKLSGKSSKIIREITQKLSENRQKTRNIRKMRGPQFNMRTLTMLPLLKILPLLNICQIRKIKKCQFSAKIRLKMAEKRLKTAHNHLKTH